MKLFSVLDKRIRHSFANKHVQSLRARSPRLYKLLRRLWERLTPMSSMNGLTRYQSRAIDSFISLTGIEFSDSKILEIGCDSNGLILSEFSSYGARRAVGVNPGSENEKTSKADYSSDSLPANCAIVNDDASNLSFGDEEFSHIFSVSVFEHLNNFEKCLSEMYRVLERGGYLYADFGPIWSGSLGHHVYAVAGDQQARHWDPQLNPVPNHAHLLWSKERMQEGLRDTVPRELLTKILAWIYELPYINRMLYEDYLRVIDGSAFDLVYIRVDEDYIDKRTLRELKEMYPGYSEFQIRNVEILLRKN